MDGVFLTIQGVRTRDLLFLIVAFCGSIPTLTARAHTGPFLDSQTTSATRATPSLSEQTPRQTDSALLYFGQTRLTLNRTLSGNRAPDGKGLEVLNVAPQLDPRILTVDEAGNLSIVELPNCLLKVRLSLYGEVQRSPQKLELFGTSEWSKPLPYFKGMPWTSHFVIPQNFFNPEGKAFLGIEVETLPLEKDLNDVKRFYKGFFILGEWNRLSPIVVATEDPTYFVLENFQQPTTAEEVLQARARFSFNEHTQASELAIAPRNLPPTPKTKSGNPVAQNQRLLLFSPGAFTARENLQRTGIRTRKLEFATQTIPSTGFFRNTLFEVNACFEHEIDQKPVAGHLFEVRRFNGKKVQTKLASTKNGCITWADDSIRWNYFGSECFFPGTIEIKSETLGFEEIIPIDVNPYLSNTGDVWARDRRYLYENSPAAGCPPGEPHIIARNPSFSTRFYHHSVDPFLSLGLRKQVQTNISVQLKRPSFRGVNGGYREVDLPYGPYLFRYGIVNQYFFDSPFLQNDQERMNTEEPLQEIRSRFLTDQRALLYREKYLDIQAYSSIQDQFELFTWNIREMRNNNVLLFELNPLISEDKKPREQWKKMKGLEQAVFQTPLEMGKQEPWGNTIPADKAVEVPRYPQPLLMDRIKQMYANDLRFLESNQKEYFGKAVYARDQFLKLLEAPTLPNESKDFLTGPEARQLLQQGTLSPNTARKLCGFWFRKFLQEKPSDRQWPILVNNTDWVAGMLTLGFKNVQELVRNCEDETQNNPGNWFQSEFHYFLKDPKKPVYHGSIMNRFTLTEGLQLSKTFSFSRTESLGWDLGMSIRVGNLLFWKGKGGKDSSAASATAEGAKTEGAASVREMVTNRNYWLFNPQALSTGVRWTIGRQFNDNQQIADSITASNGSNFKVERLHFSLQGNDFEKCVSIRLTPGASLGNDVLINNINQEHFPQALQLAMSSGILICQGGWQGRPSPLLNESYFIINLEDNVGATASDPATNLNQTFFMKLRGQSDFFAFFSMIHDQIEIPQYERKDPYTSSVFSGETRLLELIKQLTPFHFKKLSLGLSLQEKDFHVARFSDQSESGYLLRLKKLFLKDFSLRGLKTYPGHIIISTDMHPDADYWKKPVRR